MSRTLFYKCRFHGCTTSTNSVFTLWYTDSNIFIHLFRSTFQYIISPWNRVYPPGRGTLSSLWHPGTPFTLWYLWQTYVQRLYKKHCSEELKIQEMVLFKFRGCITKCQKNSFKLCERYWEQCNIPVCEKCVSSNLLTWWKIPSLK